MIQIAYQHFLEEYAVLLLPEVIQARFQIVLYSESILKVFKGAANIRSLPWVLRHPSSSLGSLALLDNYCREFA